MSTCTTATSTHRGNNDSRRRRRHSRPPSSEAVRGHLEMRLQDLKRDWDAYKTGRSSSAPRHRRSRSASGLPSSAVTVAAPDDGFHLSLLRCSPRRLVSWLQQTGSAADAPEGPRDDEDASRDVCSVEGAYSVSVATYSSSSCSCPSQCAVVSCGYSTSSSCTSTTLPPFSSAEGGINGERAREVDEGMWWPSSWVVWISAAAIVLVVAGFVAMMIILEIAVDEDRVEYQVPT